MTSAFDRDDGHFVVLRNDDEQHSLWPAELPRPEGWATVFGPDAREACSAWIRVTWTDLRPRSLRDAS
ncbi:MAG: MbtH family protein [Pseudoclavibacter sp.]